jgi:hypothetical protein
MSEERDIKKEMEQARREAMRLKITRRPLALRAG